MGIVGVTFGNNGRIYYFDDNNLVLKNNLTVIVETEKGLQFGTVVRFIDDNLIDKNINYKKVVRVSTKKDYLNHLNNIKDAEKALLKAREMASNLKLNMRLIDAVYTFDRSQLMFRFLADERVDFRQLARDLGSTFKTRIELRQVGIRDKSKEIGGIGPCGRLLCCNQFLTEFDSVSINMAKNQSLALNPAKINGVCGRLLCCLKYEDDNYAEYRECLPEIGNIVDTPSGKGKVIGLDILRKKYRVYVEDNGIVEMEVNDNGSQK